MKVPGLLQVSRFCLLGLALGLPARAQDTPAPSPRDLAWEVYRVFHRHCADCHGGHRVKPKGKFGYVLDLDRISRNADLIVPGEPDASEIYLLMTDPDPKLRMPPQDSDALPVNQADLAIVRTWIAGGAGSGWTGDDSDSAAVPTAGDDEPGFASTFLHFVARLHPVVVHFPVALILAALGAELLGLRQAARWCLWIGALGAVGSVGSGWLAAGAEGYRPDTVFLHRWLAVATAGLALVSAGVLECVRRRPGRRAALLARMALLLTAVLVGLAGHTGGVLVHGAWGESTPAPENGDR